MTDPKPRATAAIDVIGKGQATIRIIAEDGTFDQRDGTITRRAERCYDVTAQDGAHVGQVQVYRRAGRLLARHYGVIPAHSLKVTVLKRKA